jgi:hypothetical protein
LSLESFICVMFERPKSHRWKHCISFASSYFLHIKTFEIQVRTEYPS